MRSWRGLDYLSSLLALLNWPVGAVGEIFSDKHAGETPTKLGLRVIGVS